MAYLSSLLLIAGIYLMVLISPGPNFFILSQMALDGKHKEARYVVLGVTTGSIFWVVVALAGVSTLLAQHPMLASGVRLVGAAYLAWYGIRLLRSAFRPAARKPSHAAAAVGPKARASGYRIGLLTCITNPKGAAFWTSAFAALVPAQAPGWFYIVTVIMVATMSMTWHWGVSLVFGTAALRNGYLRIERAVNGLAGGALVVLGIDRMLAR
ncbi:MAG: LysE family transporter [Burkholderiaceae bacterium]